MRAMTLGWVALACLAADEPALLHCRLPAQRGKRIAGYDRGEPFLIRSGVVYDERHRNRYYLAIGQ